MSELKIVAVITAKKENLDEVKKSLYAVVDATHKEEGSVSYELHEDINNPLKFTMLEVWKSQTAIDMHNESEHFQNFVRSMEGKVEGLDVSIIKKIY